jgi:hypothetical protein
MAAGLACSISNAALVAMGNSIALDNPPIRVAEEFAMLDVLSGGRLIAGSDKSACLGRRTSPERSTWHLCPAGGD